MIALLANRRFWLTALALILAGSFAWGNVVSWPVKLKYPGEENLAEGVPLLEMLHMREGTRIYDPPSATKFDAPSYGPLYYLLGSRLIDPQAPAYLRLRLLSMAGMLGCAAGCALLAFWLAGDAIAAVLAAFLFLSYRFVTLYGVSDRCDLVALCLCYSGFLVVYRLQDSRRLLWAVPLFLAGLFYKQQFVAAPIAILLFLMLSRRRRLALEFAAWLTVGSLATAAFFQFVVFRGQAFLRYFAIYVGALPLSRHRFGLGAFVFAVFFLFPIIVGIEFLRRHRDKLIGCYLGLALPLSLVMFAKQGSDVNYFLECALILIPLFAALIAEQIGDTLRAAELLFLLVLTLIPSHYFAADAPRPQDFTRDGEIQAFLRQRFEPGVAAMGYYGGDLARARLDVPVSAPFVYTWLVRRGFLSDQCLVERLRGRRLGLVVLGFRLDQEQDTKWLDFSLTKGVREAIVSNYEPAASLEMPEPEKFRPSDRFYIWVPRTTQPSSGLVLQARPSSSRDCPQTP